MTLDLRKIEIKKSEPKKRFGHPRFYELLEEMADLHSRKNRNYAGESDPLRNFRMCEAMDIPAWKGCMVRMLDKVSRIESLSTGVPDEVGESMKDTLMDLAVYSIIDIILYEEAKERECLKL